MSTTTRERRDELAASLAVLTETFRLRWGEPATVGDEQTGVELMALLDRHNDPVAPPRMAVIVTAPPKLRPQLGRFRWRISPAEGGLPTASGETTRWPHFLLTREQIPDGEYVLRIDLIGEPVEPARQREPRWVNVEMPLVLRCDDKPDDRVVAEFQTVEQREDGQTICTTIRESGGDRFFDVVVTPRSGRNNRVVAFRVRFSNVESVVCVGLHHNPFTGNDVGSVNLSGLMPTVNPEGAIYILGLDKHGVEASNGETFGPEDVKMLERMRDANLHPAAQKVFDDVLENIAGKRKTTTDQ